MEAMWGNCRYYRHHKLFCQLMLDAFNDNKKAVLSQGNRAMPQLFFVLKFPDNIYYKFKSSQASKARLQSSKHTGAKQNLTQNGHSRSFKVTCFGVSGKALSDYVIQYRVLPTIRFRRCSVYERSAVFPRIPNILRIMVCFHTSPLVT